MAAQFHRCLEAHTESPRATTSYFFRPVPVVRTYNQFISAQYSDNCPKITANILIPCAPLRSIGLSKCVFGDYDFEETFHTQYLYRYHVRSKLRRLKQPPPVHALLVPIPIAMSKFVIVPEYTTLKIQDLCFVCKEIVAGLIYPGDCCCTALSLQANCLRHPSREPAFRHKFYFAIDKRVISAWSVLFTAISRIGCGVFIQRVQLDSRRHVALPGT